MTELILAPEQAREDVIRTGAEVEGSAPVLITEQEVVFATAAAVRPRQRALWWTRLFSTASEARTPADDDRRTPRHYPARRSAYMEHAAMSREMSRL